MKFKRARGQGHWNWHIEISRQCVAVCLWVPWRIPSKPLLYWYKVRNEGEKWQS
jgi:hypothetical protein